MFHWISEILRRPDNDREWFFRRIDAINAKSAGGRPRIEERYLGELTIHSGKLTLGDPQDPLSLEIPNIPNGIVSLSAKLWRYPNGSGTVAVLSIKTADQPSETSPRKIGKLGVDSGTLIVADAADLAEHWTETGPDRIGVINTARDKKLLNILTRRFKLKCYQVNAVRAEVVMPIFEELEYEIEEYLESVPEYADFPFMHFYVQTNNSFDRVNFSQSSWNFIPIGNQDRPLMFFCKTGRGDGSYDVYAMFTDETPVQITIPFIVDNDGDGWEWEPCS